MHLVASVRPFVSVVRAQTDGRTDGRYQVHYLPASRSIINIQITIHPLSTQSCPTSQQILGILGVLGVCMYLLMGLL